MAIHSASPEPAAAHPSLTPFSLAGLRLANRLAVAPMTRVSAAPDGRATEAMRRYYAGFAAGGFSLVISEGIYPDLAFSQGYENQPGLATEDHAAAWRPVADAVHATGAAIVAQLMHAGALVQGNPRRDRAIAPSAVRPRGEKMPEYGGQGPYAVPDAMTEADIRSVVEGFAAAAVRARDAGFDGVEIHGANGYLIDQFLTTYTNQRTDRYGGPVERRVRFAVEVAGAVRSAVGDRYPVGIRLSQTKVNDFTYRWPGGIHDAQVLFAALRDAGVTYLHIASEGRSWLETAVLDPATGATITQVARRVAGIPVIANGGMHDPARAAHVLTEGHADLLSLGTGALAHPDYPRRLAAGLPLLPFDPAMLHPRATLANADDWRGRRDRR